MMPGFAFANAYDSSSSSALENESIDVYESQSMEDARAEEMRENEMRRDEMQKEEMRENNIHHRYDVDVNDLRSDPVSGASGPRYNSDDNSMYR